MNEPQRHTDQLDNRIDETLMMLRAAVIEQGMAVSGDNRVGEDPDRTSARISCCSSEACFHPINVLV